jgi:hypothetical protein
MRRIQYWKVKMNYYEAAAMLHVAVSGVPPGDSGFFPRSPKNSALYPDGSLSKIFRSAGMTAQGGRLRAKMAILGRNDDGSSSEPA